VQVDGRLVVLDRRRFEVLVVGWNFCCIISLAAGGRLQNAGQPIGAAWQCFLVHLAGQKLLWVGLNRQLSFHSVHSENLSPLFYSPPMNARQVSGEGWGKTERRKKEDEKKKKKRNRNKVSEIQALILVH
jgi:hypothetical protein